MTAVFYTCFAWIVVVVIVVSCRDELIIFKVGDNRMLNRTAVGSITVYKVEKCFSHCLYIDACKSVNIYHGKSDHTCYFQAESRCLNGLSRAHDYSFYDTQVSCKVQLRLLAGNRQCLRNKNGRLVIGSCDVNDNLLFELENGTRWRNGNLCVRSENDASENGVELILGNCQDAPVFQLIGNATRFYLKLVKFETCVHIKHRLIDAVDQPLVIFGGPGCDYGEQTTYKLIYS